MTAHKFWIGYFLIMCLLGLTLGLSGCTTADLVPHRASTTNYCLEDVGAFFPCSDYEADRRFPI